MDGFPSKASDFRRMEGSEQIWEEREVAVALTKSFFHSGNRKSKGKKRKEKKRKERKKEKDFEKMEGKRERERNSSQNVKI
jgi:hypothetical protein